MTAVALSAALGGGTRCRRIVTYTSGSGTFTPSVSGALLRVTLIGAGSGGAGGTTSYSGGGGAGGMSIQLWMRAMDSSYSYSVGAGGAGGIGSNRGSAGGDTTFGVLTASGGPIQTSSQLYGAYGAGFYEYNNGQGRANCSLPRMGIACGGGGGYGGYWGAGYPKPGRQFGLPYINVGLYENWGTSGAAGSGSSSSGGGGGGGSLYGKGGAGGTGGVVYTSATGSDGGIGAGGGGGGKGTGGNSTGGAGGDGLIIIEDYGI